MKDFITLYFDELALIFLILVTLGIWMYKPDAKEWVGSFIAALIMALRNKNTIPKE